MNELFLPGLEPDFDVKKELRLIGGMPDLHQFDFVFISCSGGKDSHAMAYLLAELADRQKYNKNKMELLYADTGLEWHDTFDQVKRIGQSIGIQAVMVTPKYKLLDNVRRRWAKFNGLEWEDSRAEQTTCEAERREFGKSVPKLCSKILHKRSQTLANRAVCPFPSNRIMWCRSHGKQFPIELYVRHKSRGGGICGTDHSPAFMQDFAPLGKSKNLNINISVNPFPTAHRRFCTGEGKNNAIFERVRNQSKAEDG